jgi:hypothetical protein
MSIIYVDNTGKIKNAQTHELGVFLLAPQRSGARPHN